MARVAIVTGGTRGIGEAISIALKDMGMQVAANYAGNDERAREFTERTIVTVGDEPVFRRDGRAFAPCLRQLYGIDAVAPHVPIGQHRFGGRGGGLARVGMLRIFGECSEIRFRGVSLRIGQHP